MATAKDIRVAPISAATANALVRSIHYSGKVVHNSQLHLGVWIEGSLEGAMQFGPPLDKRKLLPVVEGTQWNGMMELNRLAFGDALPRNSESRALAVALRMISREYPHVEWIVSFADGTQCGDGTIYRAAGFLLTGIRKNTSTWALNGHVVVDVTVKSGSPARREVFSRTSLTDNSSKQQQQRASALAAGVLSLRGGGSGKHTGGTNGGASMRAYKEAGFRPLPGFQLRYIYPLRPGVRERLTCPILPYSAIAEAGAEMYKGQKIRRPKQAMAGTTGTAEGQHLPGRSTDSESTTAHMDGDEVAGGR